MQLYTKIVTILLVAFAVVVIVLALIGLQLPTHASTQRSIVIKAPRATVFALTNSAARRSEWSPWLGTRTDVEISVEGPVVGIGSRMSWHSDASGAGSGSMEIVDSEPHSRVKVQLDFAGRGTATSTLDLETDVGGTVATWRLETELGNGIAARYFGLAFDSATGPYLERGLVNLKELAESLPGTDIE